MCTNTTPNRRDGKQTDKAESNFMLITMVCDQKLLPSPQMCKPGSDKSLTCCRGYYRKVKVSRIQPRTPLCQWSTMVDCSSFNRITFSILSRSKDITWDTHVPISAPGCTSWLWFCCQPPAGPYEPYKVMILTKGAGSLPPLWETQTEFLPPDFSLLQTSEEWTTG